ncbi:MAG: LPS export ABC transporter periplasmic protein LptC [Hyphomicrobium sp.]|nr:LPS export ABC transporter periplasmic protein LptC [Hyphomicrobium sp.]
MTAEPAQTMTEPRRTGLGIVIGMDRSRSFRDARRHSSMVRMLRLGLPALALGLVGFYGAALFKSSSPLGALPAIPIPRITAEDLAMQNPHYEGFTDDGGSYAVDAKSARVDPKNVNEILLTGVSGQMIDAQKSATRLSADRGRFSQKTSVLQLSGRINVVSEQGLKAALATAHIDTKQGIVRSRQPVKVAFPAGTITSKEMTLRQKAREITFVNAVVAKLTPPKDAAASQPVAGAPAKLFGASDTPVDITASRLDIKDAEKKAIFTGNVKASQAGSQLETPELAVTYSGAALPVGQTNAGTGTPSAGIREIVAKGPVVMTRGDGERVTANGATFDAERETALLQGNVEMSAGPERRASGDEAFLDQKADTAVLTGNVAVTQGANVLKGRRLAIDRTAGVTELTSPPMNGSGPGRINVRLVQNKKPGASPSAKKPEPSASTKSSGAMMSSESFRADPNQPLDLEADSLEVRDATKIAYFRGGVVATQGEMRLKADTIEARYSGTAKLADITAAPAGATQGGQQGPGSTQEATALERLDAKRNIEMTSSDGRKVTGDWATFDAAANTVQVGGQVELTQGLNTVRGKLLVVDLTTGDINIDKQPKAAAKGTPGGGWSADATADGQANGQAAGSKARPSAIFFPRQLKEGGAGGEPPKAAKSGSEPAWSTSTSTPESVDRAQ